MSKKTRLMEELEKLRNQTVDEGKVSSEDSVEISGSEIFELNTRNVRKDRKRPFNNKVTAYSRR